MTKDTMIDEIFERFDGAFAENTIRAYRSDFEQYSKWCGTTNISPIPSTASNLAMYIDDLSQTCKSATIRRRINALGTVYKLSRNPDFTKDPEVVLALKRMHRKIGRRQKQAIPLTYDNVEQLLCSFCFEDMQHSHTLGNVLWLRKSKTDQFGEGRSIVISDRLFDLIQEWRRACGIGGPILRGVDKHGNVSAKQNPGSIGTFINGLNLKLTAGMQSFYGGHSSRLGKALDLFAAGKSIEHIMIKGGWQTIPSALTYLRNSTG